MTMDIEKASTSESASAWYEGRVYKSFLAAFSIIRWVIVAAVFGLGVYMYQRDVNAQQTVNVGDLDRKYSRLEQTVNENRQAEEKHAEKMLTREVYEAYHNADAQRMDRIEKSLEMIAQRP